MILTIMVALTVLAVIMNAASFFFHDEPKRISPICQEKLCLDGLCTEHHFTPCFRKLEQARIQSMVKEIQAAGKESE